MKLIRNAQNIIHTHLGIFVILKLEGKVEFSIKDVFESIADFQDVLFVGSGIVIFWQLIERLTLPLALQTSSLVSCEVRHLKLWP